MSLCLSLSFSLSLCVSLTLSRSLSVSVSLSLFVSLPLSAGKQRACCLEGRSGCTLEFPEALPFPPFFPFFDHSLWWAREQAAAQMSQRSFVPGCHHPLCPPWTRTARPAKPAELAAHTTWKLPRRSSRDRSRFRPLSWAPCATCWLRAHTTSWIKGTPWTIPHQSLDGPFYQLERCS